MLHIFRHGRVPFSAVSLLVVSCVPVVPQPPGCTDLSTSFEFTDRTGEFTLGDSPLTVTFTGGLAQSVGNFSLYRTGLNAWMISPGETGRITFETPTEEVRLYYRDQSAGVGSVLTVLDTAGATIETFEGTRSFVRVDVTVDLAESSPIGSITVRNNNTSGFSVIDDFSFCAADIDGDIPLDDPIPEAIEPGGLRVRLETVTTGLTAPNWGIAAPGNSSDLFVVDQDGILWSINLDTGEKSVFLDVTGRLVELGAFGPESFDERGFLGLAFHPDYAANGLLYTSTSEPADEPADFTTIPSGATANHQSVIVEWQVPDPADAGAVVDPGTARELLRIDQPQFNHNAGALNFGPDGMLYIALGDGGGADDVDGQDFLGEPMIGHGSGGNGQDPTNPFGSILRIDPEGSNSVNGQYGVPADNPFVESAAPQEYVDEVFALGFRNPFRFSFDSISGDLYVADVGQNDIEEISIVVSGGNYGWNLMEGTFAFNPNGNDPGFVTEADSSTDDGLIAPIAQYDHDEGVAIIGGFVYRGSAIPALFGRYVFGDYARTGATDGRLFHLDETNRVVEFEFAERDALEMALLGHGQDANGELYVLANLTGIPFGDTGVVMRIAAESGDGG